MNNRLRELRLEMGLTQRELARLIGSTDKNIWAYEKGNVNPPADILIGYSEFFGVTVDFILGLENDYGAKTAAPMGDNLTASERALLADFRKLSPYLQGIAINTVRGLTGAGAGDLHKKA